MCGIVGYWAAERIEDQTLAERMACRMEHRGPDSHGVWQDAEAGLAFAHRRLSIVDLSEGGHQPMVSASRRRIICYNGEIYNFEKIRKLVDSGKPGHGWRGHSDTEVLLTAIDTWGLERAVAQLDGMFAFAIWERDTRELTLVRDRMGEKPLYYGWVGSTLLFGSELSSLAPFPGFNPVIDRNALAAYLRHNYVPSPHCIYEGFKKLPAAHLIRFSHPEDRAAQPSCYWDLPQITCEARPWAGTDAEAVDTLDALLTQSVARRMVADVPVGTFLSGGFDSSLITAVMQSQSSRPVHTFTIGFNEEGYNEAVHAKAVATHLGTEHTELYVSGSEATDVVDKVPRYWSEPFADSSQIPTYLVSQLARQDVTVSLSGDGGDELFHGYARYGLANRTWNKLEKVPAPLRKLSSAAIKGMNGAVLSALLKPVLGDRKARRAADRIGKAAELLDMPSRIEFYRSLVSHDRSPEMTVIGAREPHTFFDDTSRHEGIVSFSQQMMLVDAMTYLPDDILVKVDRAGMAVSLEGRIPLLDHNIVEFAMGLPLHLKTRDGIDKWILRQVLYRHVPKSIMDRPKMGFGIPLEDWLRGPLKSWAADLLAPALLERDGLFDPQIVSRMWREHQEGTRRWHGRLWDILMFQAWYHNPDRLCGGNLS